MYYLETANKIYLLESGEFLITNIDKNIKISTDRTIIEIPQGELHLKDIRDFVGNHMVITPAKNPDFVLIHGNGESFNKGASALAKGTNIWTNAYYITLDDFRRLR